MDKFVIKLASPNTSLEELLRTISKINNSKTTVQLFDSRAIMNEEHLISAYLNAKGTFAEHTNIADSVAMEMLLFVAMTRQIKDAIEKAGAKSSNNMLIFADSKASFAKISKSLKNIRDFKPTSTHQAEIAKKLGIKSGKMMNQLLLQRIALSRLD